MPRLRLSTGSTISGKSRPRAWTVPGHAAPIPSGIQPPGPSAATHSTLNIPITATLDGQPWTHGIVVDHQAIHSLPRLRRVLHIGCYVLIAHLSGMRDSEIKHLRRGCLRTEHDTQGDTYRWKITSLAFTGERDPTGVEATWVIGQPAARAIAVLEQLQRPETELLFTDLAQKPEAGAASRASNSAVSNSSTNQPAQRLHRLGQRLLRRPRPC